MSILLLILFLLLQSKESRVIIDIETHQNTIHAAAQRVYIQPRIIASVIYAERFLNFNWDDDILDKISAYSGYNSSIGFCQIKVSTAFWIEEQACDQSSKYYLGKEIATGIKRSKSREELIIKLSNDTININYCAIYVAMIKKRWKESGFFFSEENETGILATLYSLGLIDSNGNERLPKTRSSFNHFGQTAQTFFESFAFRK
jgi:hypothetical protein